MSALVIANTQIRRDAADRYCLNDLHQASGSNKRHQPHDWLRLAKTQELVLEIEQEPAATPGNPGVKAIESAEGRGGGTYAVKELVYAYAMWISAKFHLHVIRAYDAMVTQPRDQPPAVPNSPQHRADVLVSATRTFAALARVGRTLRMGHARTLAAANVATYRATGIDLVQEMDAADMLADGVGALPDGLSSDLATWLEGRDDVSTRDIITGMDLGEPDDIAVQMRVAAAMRSLGWLKIRTARPERQLRWRRE